MAKRLSQINIETSNTIDAWHVTQSIDAFTGVQDYDINLSGSIALSGSLIMGPSSTTSGRDTLTQGSQTNTSGQYAVSFGYFTSASGDYSLAEGYSIVNDIGDTIYNHAKGVGSHAEGTGTLASASYSHAEGSGSKAVGVASHAEGINTISSGSGQLTIGRYNTHGDSTSRFIVGNGTTNSARADAFKVTHSGSIKIPTTQSSAPTWTGTDGEIIPATISGSTYLYIWGNGSWNAHGTPYKKYVALLTQTGSSAPVATVLENTLSGTPVWSYDGIGEYRLTLASEWTANKTTLLISQYDANQIVGGTRLDANEMYVFSTTDAGVYANNRLFETTIEIRVYP